MAIKNGQKQGRVIRRYRRRIPIKEFEDWQELINTQNKGCGLYALYRDDRLMYIGLATKSIRSRIRKHREKWPFSHFSVFLVSGSNTSAQKRRIRDLEALVLNLVEPRPEWNNSTTKFVGARKLLKQRAAVQRT